MIGSIRFPLLVFALIFSAPAAECQGSLGLKISKLSNGTLSDDRYSNGALGLRYDLPHGWIAVADPTGPVNLDSRKPDGPVNQCSKILVSLHAPDQVEGRFNSIAALFVFDPKCFVGAKFPTSSKDKDAIRAFAGKVANSFAHTPYISPHGVDIGVDYAGKQLIVSLTGENTIDANQGNSSATNEPIHVNMLFALTEVDGYWVIWTGLTDDASKEELKNSKMEFKQ